MNETYPDNASSRGDVETVTASNASTPPSAQVTNELIARSAITPAARNHGRLHGPYSETALIQANIAATLALLDEQKRTNRLLIATAQVDDATATVGQIKADMDANTEALAKER